MIDRKALKMEAKKFAFANKFKIWVPFICTLVLGIISFLISTLFMDIWGLILTLIMFVIDAIIIVGSIKYLLHVYHGKELKLIDAILSELSNIKVILMTFVIIIIATLLWSILLIIPGIIYAISVSFAIFILAEDEEKKLNSETVIVKSRKLLDGYKMDYFIFNLSFIGWILLGLITLGIAYIWVIPYVAIANIKYYEELKKIKNEEIK